MKKRLFIFASWDLDALIDDSLIHYVTSLSKLGDVIFIMDNNTSAAELKKIKDIPNIIFADATRHGEYDFGSYKRGYMYAEKKKILKNYEWVYFVNDSAYGPLRPLAPILQNLENDGAEFIGMVFYTYRDIGLSSMHLQSWFVGMNPKIFMTDWFRDFIHGVRHHDDKEDIILSYEVGMSQLIVRKGFRAAAFEKKHTGLFVYKHPLALLKRGLPFVKKAAMKNTTKKKLSKLVSKEMLGVIIGNMTRCRVHFLERFKRLLEFRLFFIPIFKITTNVGLRYASESKKIYKFYLFGFIPLFSYRQWKTKQD